MHARAHFTSKRPARLGRGFLTGRSTASLRKRLHDPALAKLWQRLVQRTHASIQSVRASGFSVRQGSLAWHSATPVLREAALMVLVDDDTDALDYVGQAIDFLDQYTAAESEPFLLHSYAQVAMAADMLRTKLDGQRLATVGRLMREKAIDFGCRQDPQLQALGSNIAFARDLQCGTCALLWGADSQSTTWQGVVERGLWRLEAYLRYGGDAEGHSYEGAGYGNAVWQLGFQWVELLRTARVFDAYRALPRLRQVLEASLQSLLPDRRFLINDNDHGLIAAESLWFLLPAARRYRDPVYLSLWHAYQGPEHPIRPYGDQAVWISRQLGQPDAPPDATASMFYAFLYWEPEQSFPALETIDRPTVTFSAGTHKAHMRTTWSSEAVFVQFLGAGRSPMSLTHRHADAGHFSLFAYGDYLAIDTGRYNADEDQHSVVMVDGRPFAPQSPGWGINQQAGRLLDTHHETPVVYACADMAHMKGCYWARRHLLFVTCGVDQAYVVMVDDLNPDNQAHDFLWQLQVHPQATIQITSAHQACVQGAHARLDTTFLVLGADVHPDDPHTLSLEQDVKGWQQPYGPDQPITGLLACDLLLSSVKRPRLLARCHGVNGKIMALLSPRRAEEKPLAVSRASFGQTMAMQIDTGAGTDTILTAPSHGLIETPALRCLSELVWMRHDGEGRLLRTWTLGGAEIHWNENGK